MRLSAGTSVYRPDSRSNLTFSGVKEVYEKGKPNGWERPPIHKRIFDHRHKWMWIPFLGSLLPALHQALPVQPVRASNVVSQSTGKASPLKKTDHPVKRMDRLLEQEKQVRKIGYSILAFLLFVGFDVVLSAVGDSKKKLALHELGHFLVAVKQEILVVSVSISWARSGVRHQAVDYPQDLLIEEGGTAMEILTNGFRDHYCMGLPVGDSFCRWRDRLGLMARIKDEPGKNLKLLLTAKQEAMSILVEFDRQKVEALADRLVKDGQWDVVQIKEIIRELGLQLPNLSAAQIKEILQELHRHPPKLPAAHIEQLIRELESGQFGPSK